jgi:hypothetical protein
LTLRNIFLKYGRSARHCYSLARNPADVVEWELQIPNLLASMPDIAMFEGHIAGNTIEHTDENVIKSSSQLITIIPNATRQPRVTLVSRHIAEHFFRAVLVRDHEKFWDYFNRFSSVPESRTPAGWLWELYAIQVDLKNRKKRTISLRQLSPITPPSEPPKKKSRVTPDGIMLPFSPVTRHGDKVSLGKELSRIVPSLSPSKPALFIPGARNQATFDAFSISSDNLVTLYQATIQRSHSVKAKGLDFVWDALAEGTPLVKRLMPSARKWRVVFLIPEEVEAHWEKPQDIDFGGIKPKRQWGQYVEQFVGVLPKRYVSILALHA